MEQQLSLLFDLPLPKSPAALAEKQARLKALHTEKIRREATALQRARTDYCTFAERVIKDESTNQPIQLAAIHRDWIRHIHESFALGKHAVICAPPGHGKTSHFGLGFPLFALGRDASIRIAFLSSAAGASSDRLSLMADYIENDEDYQTVFPHVRPDYDKGWNKSKIFVTRETKAKEPSIQAAGIGGSLNGRRLDLVICDDISDDQNTLHQPAKREMIWTTYRSTVVNRLEPGGKIVILQTRWHEADLVGKLLAEPHMRKMYAFLIQRVSEDFERIDCEVLVNADVGKFVKHRSELHKLFALSQHGMI